MLTEPILCELYAHSQFSFVTQHSLSLVVSCVVRYEVGISENIDESRLGQTK